MIARNTAFCALTGFTRYLAVAGGIWRYLAISGGIRQYSAVFGRYCAITPHYPAQYILDFRTR